MRYNVLLLMYVSHQEKLGVVSNPSHNSLHDYDSSGSSWGKITFSNVRVDFKLLSLTNMYLYDKTTAKGNLLDFQIWCPGLNGL